MIFFATLCITIAVVCFCMVKEDSDKKGASNKDEDSNKMAKGSKVKCILLGVGMIILAIFLMASDSGSSSSSSSKWNSLSKEEKAWYQRNYGNGKMESINSAISNYKSSH